MSEQQKPQQSEARYGQLHRRLFEGRAAVFTVAMTVAILIGGIVELVPMFTTTFGPERAEWVTPYTPLEVAGRDIYVREGCYVCHSQMVRPMRAEMLRYGEWTRAAEYMYDRPFQLGSRRIGPDVQRIGPSDVTASVKALAKVGTPYEGDLDQMVPDSLQSQGRQVVANLATAGIEADWDQEIVALIAYLQRLGVEGRRHLSEGGGR
jgi:cytochrome c oxidase cbb3-type subunit I/II